MTLRGDITQLLETVLEGAEAKMINQQVKIIFRFSFLFFLQSSSVFAATYYLSPTGSDTNNGSAGAPLATIMMAQSIAASGDTVIINAGTYTVPVSISLVSGVWAIVNNINKNGITYQAAPGTRPVFDFSGVTDPGLRIVAFWVTATGVTFQGFDVIGVRETITGVNNQSVGMFGWGSKNCTWNQVHVHDGECVGFYFQKVSSNNLVYQCDSYNNAGIDGPIPAKFYGPDEGTRPEGWIHNMEHGAVVILYNCKLGACDDATQAALQAIPVGFPDSPVCGVKAGVLAPVVARFDNMPTEFAALVWDRVLYLSTLDVNEIKTFYATQGELYNPEPQCTRPSPSPSAAPSSGPSSGASSAPSSQPSVEPSSTPAPTASPSAS